MVAGFCRDTAVCGDGVLNLLSEGHWRGSRKRFNQSINQLLWSSSLSGVGEERGFSFEQGLALPPRRPGRLETIAGVG